MTALGYRRGLRVCRCWVAIGFLAPQWALAQLDPQLSPPAYPEGAPIPRSLTAAEVDWLRDNPLAVSRGAATPSGPIHCVAEYEPMEGVIIAWEGETSWRNILAAMTMRLTTTAQSRVWVAVDSTSERSSATTTLTSAGADMSRVTFIVTATDTIWMRDYGPRYIYEGDCRAIVDHEYNRPRPADDVFPDVFSALKNHATYYIPLIHGGGNYHLNALSASYATRLIKNENPSLTEAQIQALWASYQNVNTTLRDPFPTSIDSTQHIDMWMQIIADDAVMISDWPANSSSTQDNICDTTASLMQTQGFTVHRLPARRVNSVHYTYTNVVMCNNVVLIPSYTNATIAPYNAQALTTWQDALPTHQIFQINCEAIVPAAGVMHCIVMHVPAPLNGASPSAYLKNFRGGESLDPGEVATIQWISDDDVAVANVDLLLSLDGGATFPLTIASATADDGSYAWTVPDLYSTQARIRVLARDGGGNTGADESPGDIVLNGAPPAPCPEDLDGSGGVDLPDVSLLLAAFATCEGEFGYNAAADLDGDDCVALGDLSLMLSRFGMACP